MPIVRLEDINFSYNNLPVLEGIWLDINKGDFLGIIGPNGGGKTTLLKVILGLVKPQKGKVELFGEEISKFHRWDKIGYVPQKINVANFSFPVSVEEVIDTAENKKKSAKEVLPLVELDGFEKRKINELSGGQLQRVFIAKALASEPELLLLDEPTVGVDAQAQEKFYMLLRKLNQQHKLTLALVSHDIDVVANEVNMIVCINTKMVCHTKPQTFIKEDYLKNVYGKDLKFILHHH